jgi:hypothetical protein
MLRILVLLCSGAFFSTSFPAQGPDELEIKIVDDVIYGHDYGMAMTFDVYRPSRPNGTPKPRNAFRNMLRGFLIIE